VIVDELKDFRDKLMKYIMYRRKHILEQENLTKKELAEFGPIYEEISISAGKYAPLIKEYTGLEKITTSAGLQDVWNWAFSFEQNTLVLSALSDCLQATGRTIGKLEDDIEKGVRDKQGKLIEKPQRIDITKPQFSNRTLSYIVEIISDRTDTELRNLFFKYSLLDIYQQSGKLTAKKRKVNDVFQHLSNLCSAGDENAADTLNLIIREALKDIHVWLEKRGYGGQSFSQVFPELARALSADGFQVHEEELVPIISPAVEPAKEEGLVEKLLDKYGFAIARNHLEQSYDNYLDGNWEAANAALRSFLQDVFDQTALTVAPEEAASIEPGGKRRKLLEEKGFIETDTESKLVSGFFKFASYKGSHPGISNESDCRLRRYIAIAMASYYLERLGEFHI